MSTDPAVLVETLRDALEAGERGGHPRDRELLLEFSDQVQLLPSKYSDYRHDKLLRHCVRMAEEIGDGDELVLEPVLTNRSAAEQVVRWIHRTYENPETNRDYRNAIRAFGKRVADTDQVGTDEHGIPLSLAWIPTETPSNYDPQPKPSELFDWDDIDAMTEAARNSRDAAMVNLMMDAGPRGGEFFDLEVGDLTDADHGLQVWLEGKTGQRSVTLIPSVPHVRRWLSDHPGDDSDPLWCRLSEPEAVSKQYVYDALKKLARRAGIDPSKKRPTPTNFRKSNASWLARTGANASLIEERQGRTRGSDVVSRYVATFGEENEQSAYARLHGREVDDDAPDRRDVVMCPRCEKENPPTEGTCMWCGQGLDPEGVAEAEQADRELHKAFAKLDPETAEQVIDAFEVIDSTPELRAAFRRAGNS